MGAEAFRSGPHVKQTVAAAANKPTQGGGGKEERNFANGRKKGSIHPAGCINFGGCA